MVDDQRYDRVGDDLDASPKLSVDAEPDRYVEKAGKGYCKSCDCKGYVPAKDNYCQCGHHYSQHYGIG